MAIDIVQARRETPGCGQVLHFNNAGAALMPHAVLNAIHQHLQREALMGAYEAAEAMHGPLEQVYDCIAELIGAQRDEIALVENATRAWDMAFYAIPFQAGDRILTSTAEYGSNYLAFLQMAERTGVRIEAIPNDEHGQISIAALRAAIDERVKLIALTHVPTNGGLVNPAAEVGRVAREADVLYLLDACQSVGQMPIDVETIGCDLLAATGRKYLRGPRGTGFLYVRRAVLDQLQPPFIDMQAATWTAPDAFAWRRDARKFENWEAFVAGRLGLGVAAAYALSWGLGEIEARITLLAERLRHELQTLPGLAVQDLGERRCGIVSFTVAGHDADALKQALGQKRINVSVSRVTSTRLDMEARQLDKLVRASVHYYNTDDEIDRFVATLRTVLRR